VTRYFAAVSRVDSIKRQGVPVPLPEWLEHQPDGLLTSLAHPAPWIAGRDEPAIVDCGAPKYIREPVPRLGRHLVTPAYALDRYLPLSKPGGRIVAPDHILAPGLPDPEGRRRFNRESAVEFLQLDHRGRIPMAAVHGESVPERVERAVELAEVGYQSLAVGGLVKRSRQTAFCIDVVGRIRRAVPGVYLHVLGLSALHFVAAWRSLGVDSCDSASPIRQALNGAFWEHAHGDLVEHSAVGEGEAPTAPICDCPACAGLRLEGIDTRTFGSNEHNIGRGAHNLGQYLAALSHTARPALVLVSCVKGKHRLPLPAADLYESDWFRKARAYAEHQGGRWMILSAEHGLLDPAQVVQPYERSLYDMGAPEREAWAGRVVGQLLAVLKRGERVEILAGKPYRQHLVPALLAAGREVTVPMAGMEIGQQKAWLLRAVRGRVVQQVEQSDLFRSEAA
jgi:hypothetical protein